MKHNPISTKYEPLQATLIGKVHKLNKKVYKAIQRANVNTANELLTFLGAYLSVEFGKIRTTTQQYLGVVKEDVKEISNNNDLAPNKTLVSRITNQTYIELNTNLVCAEKELMQEFKQTIKPFKNTPTHIVDVKTALQNDFVKTGMVKVTYRNGAKMPLDKYFMMATRTARNETQNATVIDNAIKLGTDYVYMAPNTSSCKTCSALGNRVYCISGKDPRYPSVYDVLFKNGYTCIHPHCKCMLRPYFMENHTQKENEQLQKESNRDYDLDQRTEEQRQQYQESQAFNHNQWATQQKFEQMQQTYGNDAPYKTLGGLRRGKTTQSVNYKALHYEKRDKAQYESWTNVLGKNEMPETLAKFQELKYNNNATYNTLALKVKIARHQEKIRANPINLNVEVGKQEKHFKSAKNYQKGKSYFKEDLTITDIQNIITTHATHGTVKLTKKGEISNKELIKCDEIVGYCQNKQGKWVATKYATIHYSNKGTHLVPTIKE